MGGDTGTGEGIVIPVITPAFLSGLLMKMRELRVMDVASGQSAAGQRNVSGSYGSSSTTHGHGHAHAHGYVPGGGRGGVQGRGVAVNKMLERTQAAG
jgi:hypothetical protein